MNELTVNDILEEMCDEEVSEYMKMRAPRHHFSRRHRKAMDEILRSRVKYKNIPLKKRVCIAILVIILAVIGTTAGAEAIRGFNSKVRYDNTELLTANAENCPKTIENVYYLSDIPEGYELLEEDYTEYSVYRSYMNFHTNRIIVFTQNIKEKYKEHFDNVHHTLEELEIDGHYAIYLNDNDSEISSGIIIWDNGYYVLGVSGDLAKDELVKLVKSAKL